MMDFDRELVDTYLEESREHLASIEEDLVELERQGEARDDGLDNKIFRAAHSIKGGAGFFDFKVIKDLAHKLENVLDLVRSGKMKPNPEIVTILLRGFDRLSSLIEASETSDSADVSDELVALIGLSAEYSPEVTAAAKVSFSAPGSSRELEADQAEVERLLGRGLSLFLLRFDLVHDVQRQGRTPLDIIHSLLDRGEILDSAIDFRMVGTLDDESPGDDVPYFVLYATSASVLEISRVHEIPQAGISLLRLASTPAPAPEPAPAPGPTAVPAPEPTAVSTPVVAPTPQPPVASAPSFLRRAASTKPASAPGPASASPPPPATVSASPSAAAPPENESVRVSVGVLDDLMNLSGELVLVRNELADAARRANPAAIQLAVNRMNSVTSGIQDAVTRSRMQPASNLFARYQRTVRDLSRDLGKEIELKLSGRETELDRSLIETLSDPLTHLVRNACDHGIETTEVRARLGKPARGTIALSAAHEAGQVVIEIDDDGKGIDADKVAAKAVAMGLATADRVSLMSRKEKLYFITLPGLSTASQVSDLSGRGVGMDVVKANVDRLGGRLDIDSTPGVGTKVRINLPLTLSIIPALIAGVGRERFALPQAAAAELLHIRAGDVQRRIERMGDRAVLVLRGEVLPLVRLADALGMERLLEDPESGGLIPDRRQRIDDRRSPTSGAVKESLGAKPMVRDRMGDDRRYRTDSDYRVIVVRASGFQYGVIVDELFDTTEIVVKPLGRHLKALKNYSGATILGDGTVALIIDPAGLALKAGLTTASEEPQRGTDEATAEEARDWLLFRNGPTEPCAMPMEAVERVVRVQKGDLDAIGRDWFLRVGGQSLPVFSVASFTGLTRFDAEASEACVLCLAEGRRFGFLASPPVDSVAASASLDDRSMRKPGVAGTAVIQGRTTVVIDPAEALRHLKPEWFGPSAAPESAPRNAEGPLIVVAEDSEFLRKMVVDLLTGEGYRVRGAADGQEALELVQTLGAAVSLVVSDVEMPRLDGRELTRRLGAEFAGLPVIALTSLASADDERSIRDAGARDYLVKLDREELLASVRSALKAVLTGAREGAPRHESLTLKNQGVPHEVL